MKLTAVKTARKPNGFKGLAPLRESYHDAPVRGLDIGFGKLTAVKIDENRRRINDLAARGGC